MSSGSRRPECREERLGEPTNQQSSFLCHSLSCCSVLLIVDCSLARSLGLIVTQFIAADANGGYSATMTAPESSTSTPLSKIQIDGRSDTHSGRLADRVLVYSLRCSLHIRGVRLPGRDDWFSHSFICCNRGSSFSKKVKLITTVGGPSSRLSLPPDTSRTRRSFPRSEQ